MTERCFAPVSEDNVRAARTAFADRLAAHPFMLAPMAGVTDPTYRELAVEHGCPLCYSEMVSVAGIAHASDKTWELVDPAPGERQFAVQLFGSRPEQFAPAAAAVVERLGERLALLDINMACPVPKVFKKGEGSALMDDPERAVSIVVETLRGAAGAVPVTCKIRAGIYQSEELAPDFARRLEEAGASGVAVHGRAAKQFYTGKADWSVIKRVVEAVEIPVVGSGDVYEPSDCASGVAVHGRAAKQFYTGKADWSVIKRVVEAVEIPVVGSGDVYEPSDCVRMLAETGCSGVFVARGSYGNPWIFERAYSLWRTGVELPSPSVAERLATLRDHIERFSARGCHMARLRPVTCWYIKGLPAAATWRDRAMQCRSADDFLALVDAMETACREHGML